ncbi:hypothetical protein I352_03486 [Cryptococcus deuterogattii MMRL2647]|nr:hypothetical protein I352_03486 [Cryptococcus deuterogattii MMRL2647]
MASSGTTSNSTQNSSDQDKSSKKVARTWPDSSSTKAKKAAAALSQNVKKAYDFIAESFGGIQCHNPTFYRFAEKTVSPNVIVRNKASKVLFTIIGIGVLQISGIEELQKFFASGQSAAKVKSILTVFVVTSTLQLVPSFLFDTHHHFKALWGFFLPYMLFIAPCKDAPGQTVAALLCDTLFAPLSTNIGIPFTSIFPDHDGQITAMLAFITLALMLWAGYLGGQAAYFIIWAFVCLSTVNALGQPLKSKETSSTQYYKQMTVWHNLMAIWLWRLLISVIEGTNIPGIASAIDFVLYYIPNFYLWVTVFIFAALVTKQTADHHHYADTWYARCLTRSKTVTKER